MSAKWRRVKAWDDENLTGWLVPVKWVLRAFSSIPLAVVLLLLVSAYGVLASVPIGMLAWGVTYAVYGLTLLGSIALIAGVPLVGGWYAGMRRWSRAARFVTIFVGGLALSLVGAWLWQRHAWPRLHWDPATDGGFKLWPEFVREYRSTTLRRLPGLEMSELEFYSWWPLRVILLLFVTNMVVATVRRIEFTFKNIGVLTVHTGIITIALGSVYYSGLKKEGDTILFAGQPGPDGIPGEGPGQDRFYDNTDMAMYVRESFSWEMRPLFGVPRYNEYNLNVAAGPTAREAARLRLPSEGWDERGVRRTLDVAVEAPETEFPIVSRDVNLRIVGYAPYAELVRDWVKVDIAGKTNFPQGWSPFPLRIVHLLSSLPEHRESGGDGGGDGGGEGANGEGASGAHGVSAAGGGRPVFAYMLAPGSAQERYAQISEMSVEYTVGMDANRWADLATPLPEPGAAGLVVEIPGAGADGGVYRGVYTIEPESVVRVGETGWTIRVSELHAEPPFPIVTEGYRGATSSVAVLRIEPPAASGKQPFDRWVYSRFPEISQDLSGDVGENGMPRRGAPDAAIRVGFIDASMVRIYLDETRVSVEGEGASAEGEGAGADGAAGAEGAGAEGAAGASTASTRVRAVVRLPGGEVRVEEDLGAERVLRDFVPNLSLRVSETWEHAERFDRPRPVPVIDRDNSLVGTHDKAVVAVEATLRGDPTWKKVVWVPFSKYMDVDFGNERRIDLPDGRSITVAFGRLMHRLPGFAVSLVDFEMIAYDHRGSPRDYQSQVRVRPVGDAGFEEYVHVTKLNAPLQAPFLWDDGRRSWAGNMAGLLGSRLNPNQFKFSQAGWDATGWEQTQARADAGQVARPFASFTILGVGNNPGIHVIALGGVLMGIGIPWAFYVKPLLVRREKRKLQEALARGEIARKPARSAPAMAPGLAGGAAMAAGGGGGVAGVSGAVPGSDGR